MAHIRKLDGGRWQARYRDAEHKERAHTLRTKAEAQRWLDEQTADLVRGDWRDPRSGRVTIGDLAETWYGTRAALKASTRLSYRSLLDAWVLPAGRPYTSGESSTAPSRHGSRRSVPRQAHPRPGRSPECFGQSSSWPCGTAGSRRIQRPA